MSRRHDVQLDAVLLLLSTLSLSQADVQQLNTVMVGRMSRATPSSTTTANLGTFATTPAPLLASLSTPTDSTSLSNPVLSLSVHPTLDHDLDPSSVPAPSDVPAPLIPDPPASPTPVSETVSPSSTATTLLHLLVTAVIVNGETWYQQTYRGFPFNVPRAGALGPFYLVTCGRRVGVFLTWQRTSPYVLGQSCASFTHVNALEEALMRMLDAIDLGEVEWLAS
ncbi:hypothetical protein BDN67DRAFT_985396 [Paxillus ammoniavirescens]|nr:hypothetical protein BDN67DRAFT_985396 [Paxillus ammoniavirescens]